MIIIKLSTSLTSPKPTYPRQIVVKSGFVPAQCDGEPWDQSPCIISVSAHSPALIMKREEDAGISWPLKWEFRVQLVCLRVVVRGRLSVWPRYTCGGLKDAVQRVTIPKVRRCSVVKPDKSYLMCLAFSSDYCHRFNLFWNFCIVTKVEYSLCRDTAFFVLCGGKYFEYYFVFWLI